MSAKVGESTRRRYDSPLRQQRASETRERIVRAGCEILRSTSIRDWNALTVRAVAARAGVNERTVYRHLTNERGLRDAVMQRLEQQAGIDLESLRLEDITDVAGRIATTLAGHPLPRRTPLDPTLSDASERQRAALRRAVAPHADGWSEADRQAAAAMFDVLWGLGPYERLVGDWHLEPEQAAAGIVWAIELLEEAVRAGRGPCIPTGEDERV